LWHFSDIHLHRRMSVIGGKADIPDPLFNVR